MAPDGVRSSDDEARVPAASPGDMERGMMRLLDRAHGTVDGGAAAQVCGLRVVFSREGDANVAWEFCAPLNQPDP